MRDGSGYIRGFDIKGHAGYAEHGSDIVCAAASVTAYTAAGALDGLAGIKDCYSEESGHFVLILPEEMTKEQSQTARIILETAEIGFRQIENSYKKFLSVAEKEV